MVGISWDTSCQGIIVSLWDSISQDWLHLFSKVKTPPRGSCGVVVLRADTDLWRQKRDHRVVTLISIQRHRTWERCMFSLGDLTDVTSHWRACRLSSVQDIQLVNKRNVTHVDITKPRIRFCLASVPDNTFRVLVSSKCLGKLHNSTSVQITVQYQHTHWGSTLIKVQF